MAEQSTHNEAAASWSRPEAQALLQHQFSEQLASGIFSAYAQAILTAVPGDNRAMGQAMLEDLSRA